MAQELADRCSVGIEGEGGREVVGGGCVELFKDPPREHGPDGEHAPPGSGDCSQASGFLARPTGRYVIRIEAHLAQLARGHDPMGHLFGIERLARSAKAEWWGALHRSEDRQPRP